MSDNIIIKGVEPADIAPILQLWKDAGLPIKSEGRDRIELLTQEAEQDKDIFLTAWDEKTMVGVVIGTDDGRKGYINRLTVHPDHQREGIAARLLEACENGLRARGREIIVCNIEDYNDTSMKFFKSQGYVFEGDILYFTKRGRKEA